MSPSRSPEFRFTPTTHAASAEDAKNKELTPEKPRADQEVSLEARLENAGSLDRVEQRILSVLTVGTSTTDFVDTADGRKLAIDTPSNIGWWKRILPRILEGTSAEAEDTQNDPLDGPWPFIDQLKDGGYCFAEEKPEEEEITHVIPDTLYVDAKAYVADQLPNALDAVKESLDRWISDGFQARYGARALEQHDAAASDDGSNVATGAASRRRAKYKGTSEVIKRTTAIKDRLRRDIDDGDGTALLYALDGYQDVLRADERNIERTFSKAKWEAEVFLKRPEYSWLYGKLQDETISWDDLTKADEEAQLRLQETQGIANPTEVAAIHDQVMAALQQGVMLQDVQRNRRLGEKAVVLLAELFHDREDGWTPEGLEVVQW